MILQTSWLQLFTAAYTSIQTSLYAHTHTKGVGRCFAMGLGHCKNMGDSRFQTNCVLKIRGAPTYMHTDAAHTCTRMHQPHIDAELTLPLNHTHHLGCGIWNVESAVWDHDGVAEKMKVVVYPRENNNIRLIHAIPPHRISITLKGSLCSISWYEVEH
jgi:hypothetical protein